MSVKTNVMKSLFIIAALISAISFSSHPTNFIDPTGTYILKGKVQKNEIVTHSGELRVKLLNKNKVALSFFISKGYPGYEFGSFTDTVSYDETFATYRSTRDKDCNIVFFFSPTSAETQLVYSDPHCSCGFAKGVMISTVFEKKSSDEPVIQDLSSRGIANN